LILNIPNSVVLANIPVITVQDNLFEQHGCIGHSVYAEQGIFIDPTCAPIETTEQAYWHELVHWILFIMNEHELRDNEKFVDTFGHLLYQAIDTGGFSCQTRFKAAPNNTTEEV